jgi:glycosyltransferase involved in cell wall biosynthesis
MKKKIVLVKLLEVSSWVSCQTITKNLANSYENNDEFEIVDTINIYNNDPFSSYQSGHELSKIECDIIAFIDHHPCPASIVRSMHSFCTRKKKPDLIFHVFGDFTLQSSQWFAIDDILRDYKVKFICASIAQKKLLDNFLNQSSLAIASFFPVNIQNYFFDSKLRASERKKLNLEDDEIAIVYTGRLSIQKNIIELVQYLDEAKKVFGLNFKLFVSGPFDDIGVPYLGMYSTAGANVSRWTLATKDKRNYVSYLGNLNSKELLSLYCASDLFVSLSTHNDEDFGMSPAEAATCGLPMILSNWGGYSSFKNYFTNCDLVKTDFKSKDSNRAMPNKKEFFKVLINALKLEKVKERSTQDQLSIENFSNNLLTITNFDDVNNFSGFTELISKVSARFKATPESPFTGARSSYSELYYELYSSYCGDIE